MALTLGQGAQMVADPGYSARVRDGMVRYAATVMAEALNANSQTLTTAIKRKRFANQILVSPNSYVDAFLSVIASDPASSLTWYQPVLITSSTNANPSVVTTATVHGLAVGDIVEVRDHATNTNINGTWVLATVGSTTTFAVPHPANAAGVATGTAMKQETDITVNVTLQGNFNALAGTYTGES